MSCILCTLRVCATVSYNLRYDNTATGSTTIISSTVKNLPRLPGTFIGIVGHYTFTRYKADMTWLIRRLSKMVSKRQIMRNRTYADASAAAVMTLSST